MKHKYVVAKVDFFERPGPANDPTHTECCFQDFALVTAQGPSEALEQWAKVFNTKVAMPYELSLHHTHCYSDFNEQYYLVAILRELHDPIDMDSNRRAGDSHSFIG
jgi:hypothetical protein